MSLKAKLEAVIYAAEEPVTLAQLAVLFAADAFEWKAEQEAVSAEQAAEAAQPLPLGITEYALREPEQNNTEPPTSEPADASGEEGAEPDAEAPPEAGAADSAAPEPPTAAFADEQARADADARRQARLRDREVRGILRKLLDELIASCASDGRGIEIREIAGGYRMATKPECHDAVRLFVKSLKPALRLSLPALETLAVIAYKQPVTAPEVNEIRGVDSSGVFGSLLARKLIATAGRKPVIGRPILYKTTREFLLRFGLKDVTELPSMEEFEKMAASELEEPEPEQAQKPNPAQGPEFDEAASEELEDAAAAQTPETPETAETAGRNEYPPTAEAAPAAPTPTEQAETENHPHDDEKDDARKDDSQEDGAQEDGSQEEYPQS
jgi:segregation and condensation protein B